MKPAHWRELPVTQSAAFSARYVVHQLDHGCTLANLGAHVDSRAAWREEFSDVLRDAACRYTRILEQPPRRALEVLEVHVINDVHGQPKIVRVLWRALVCDDVMIIAGWGPRLRGQAALLVPIVKVAVRGCGRLRERRRVRRTITCVM